MLPTAGQTVTFHKFKPDRLTTTYAGSNLEPLIQS